MNFKKLKTYIFGGKHKRICPNISQLDVKQWDWDKIQIVNTTTQCLINQIFQLKNKAFPFPK